MLRLKHFANTFDPRILIIPRNKSLYRGVYGVGGKSYRTNPGAGPLLILMDGNMKQMLRWLMAMVLAVAAPLASATFHTFQIDQIYSGADGTVQFIVLREADGF